MYHVSLVSNLDQAGQNFLKWLGYGYQESWYTKSSVRASRVKCDQIFWCHSLARTIKKEINRASVRFVVDHPRPKGIFFGAPLSSLSQENHHGFPPAHFCTFLECNFMSTRCSCIVVPLLANVVEGTSLDAMAFWSF